MRYLLINPDDDDAPIFRVCATDPSMIQHKLGDKIDPLHAWQWMVYEFQPYSSLKELGPLSDFDQY